jgi:acyl-CoA synthetase (AMP-forming)/AMP-acid ligase II
MCPGIEDAAVVGVPAGGSGSGVESAGDVGSEVPRAYLVKKKGRKIEERHIHDWMRERLAKYKMLDGGIVWVEAVPKNASGKILKREVREMAKREMGAKL